MNIVWFSWKDITHPQAGGAETVSHEIRRRLVRDGHTVSLITSAYPGSGVKRVHEGVTVYYTGGRYSVYIKARSLYRKYFANHDDVIIDEMNTIPFLASRYATAPKKILLAYQLAREVWFYQMAFPLSVIGYVLEPLLLRLTARGYNTALTESFSSKKDMERHGFLNVKVFRVGMELKPVKSLSEKESINTILSLGSIRPMKRTLDAVKSFELARDTRMELKLIIAGDTNSKYANRVIRYIKSSRHNSAIKVIGRVSAEEKVRLMKNAGAILVTSVKEGWGLIVTEANSQGTPAIAYDVDGLRDSVIDGKTGIVTKENPRAMGDAIIDLLEDSARYKAIRTDAWKMSYEYTFDNSYQDFLKVSGLDG